MLEANPDKETRVLKAPPLTANTKRTGPLLFWDGNNCQINYLVKSARAPPYRDSAFCRPKTADAQIFGGLKQEGKKARNRELSRGSIHDTED